MVLVELNPIKGRKKSLEKILLETKHNKDLAITIFTMPGYMGKSYNVMVYFPLIKEVYAGHDTKRVMDDVKDYLLFELKLSRRDCEIVLKDHEIMPKECFMRKYGPKPEHDKPRKTIPELVAHPKPRKPEKLPESYEPLALPPAPPRIAVQEQPAFSEQKQEKTKQEEYDMPEPPKTVSGFPRVSEAKLAEWNEKQAAEHRARLDAKYGPVKQNNHIFPDLIPKKKIRINAVRDISVDQGGDFYRKQNQLTIPSSQVQAFTSIVREG